MLLFQCINCVSAIEYGSCHSFAGGSVFPEGDKSADHHLQYTKAISKIVIYIIYVYILLFTYILVSKPAPSFEGTAVVNGEFRSISLKDFIGKYVVFFFYPLDL